MLDDFRCTELVRNGRRKVYKSRLRQDKGHQGEWEALVASLRGGVPAPISFEEIVARALTTFRILDSLRSGRPVDVETGDFMASALGEDDSSSELGLDPGANG